eukprot:scaffold508_cov554-Prasinococcus_capsulatus_cf.AAC.2
MLFVLACCASRGVNIDHENSLGMTPLMYCAEHEHIESIRLLLTNGARVDHESSIGHTALMVAAACNRVDSVEALLDMGASINHQNTIGKTPLMVASSLNCTNVIEILIQRGADMTLGLANDIGGKTALVQAAEAKATEAVRLLIRKGMGVNDEDEEAITLLGRVIMWGNEDLCRVLIDQCGAEIDIKSSKRGWTPLMSCCAAGNVEAVKLALRLGATVNFETESGETALLLAARLADQEMIEALVAGGAEADQVTKDGTALQKVAAEGNTNAIEALVKYANAKVDFSKPGMTTAMERAMARKHSHVVRTLIACGAKPLEEETSSIGKLAWQA